MILVVEIYVWAFIRLAGAIFFLITLVVYRAVLVKRFRQLIQWRYWVGVVSGFVTGPVYLLIHAFENVRKSDEWELITEGCNAGFGFLALTISIVYRRRLRLRNNYKQMPEFFIPLWVYGASVILTHAIRSEASDRKAWLFDCHGFTLGMLFGPFGLLFKRCIPECVR